MNAISPIQYPADKIGRMIQDGLLPPPALDLDFARRRNNTTHQGRPVLTTTRASDGTYYYGATPTLALAGGNDIARFTQDLNTGVSLGQLIEEARTNLVLHSYFQAGDKTGWGTYGAEATATTVVEGGLLFFGDFKMLIARIAGSGHEGSQQTITVTDTKEISLQVYVANIVGSPAPSISTDNGLGTTALIAGLNKVVFTATAASCEIHIFSASGSIGDGFNFSFVQAEDDAAFATSWIPTEGSTVARAADVPGVTDLRWLDPNRGIMLAEWQLLEDVVGVGSPYVWSLNEDGANRYVHWLANSTTVRTNFQASAGDSFVDRSSYNQTTLNKTAVAYAAGDGAVSLNGETVGTTGTLNLIAPIILHIGHDGSNDELNGTLRRLLYWPLLPDHPLLQVLSRL